MSLHQHDPIVRVVVADSSLIYTKLLANAVGKDKKIKVVATVASSQELLSAFVTGGVDVAVISANFAGVPAETFEQVRELRRLVPKVAVIVLVDSSKQEIIVDAFKTGVRGVFSTHESHKDLCKCIHRVHEGQVWAGHRELISVLEAFATVPLLRPKNSNGSALLSHRETQVVQCVAEGLTNREIGQRLGLSRHTIKNYLLRIFDKMGVSTRTELLYLALNQRSLHAPPVATEGNPQQATADTRFRLAMYHNDGRGGARDPIASYMWCLLAELANSELADQIFKLKQDLAKVITPDQMFEAKRRAASSRTPQQRFHPHENDTGDNFSASSA